MAWQKIQGLIDRFEGNMAVILLGPDQEEKLELSKSCLPPDAEEGSIVTLKIKVEKNRTKKAKEEVAKMITKLAKS